MDNPYSFLTGKRVLITGGTGSLGQVLVRRLLSTGVGGLRVFSRDEAKQYLMGQFLQDRRVQFQIGDIRSLSDVTRALDRIDIVFNAAALKQVPTCEYAPFQAVQTNICGAENIVSAIAMHHIPVQVVVGVSTDKACLDFHSAVELSDGTTMKISDIVRHCLPVWVKTVDKSGRFSSALVNAWYKNKLLGRAMYAVSYVNATSRAGNSTRALVTEDHLVFTQSSGWKKASDLQDGEQIFTGERAPNRRQMSLICGLLLGDASISKVSPRHRGLLRYGQAQDHERYLSLVYKSLSNLNASGITTRKDSKRQPFSSFKLKAAGFIKKLHEAFYAEGKKRVPRDLISQYFSRELLAAWFMDDGCRSEEFARIATHGFIKEDVDWLAELLSKHGYEAYTYPCKLGSKVYYELRFRKSGSRALFNIIGSMVPEGLRQKLPLAAPPFSPASWELGDPEPFIDRCVVKRSPYTKGKSRDVYCLGVEKTENFIVSGVVVHNCKPVNVMGMTKAIQERIFINGNLVCPSTRFVCSRYGNVLASRGSLIPLFHEQIRAGRALTVTSGRMTRFLMNLDEAADLVMAAAAEALPGQTFVPQVPSAMVAHIAEIFSEVSGVPVQIVGERPGEKLHEILVSEEEAARSHLYEKERRLVIGPYLPELQQVSGEGGEPVTKEYSSGIFPVTKEALRERLEKESLLPGQVI